MSALGADDDGGGREGDEARQRPERDDNAGGKGELNLHLEAMTGLCLSARFKYDGLC